MFNLKIGKDNLEATPGELATQASGSCFIKLGETSLLSTCQIGEERPGLDFFPLTCDYEERFYAAGKILGSRFIRREGRPSAEAVLISRLVDRTIRPLFPEGLKKEVQVISTCLSWDGDNDPAVLAVLGSSIALSISEIPWQGPVAAVRVGRKNGEFILNPNYEERETGEMDLVIAGAEPERKPPVSGGEKEEILVNMIEMRGEEVEEETVLEAVKFAEPFLKELVDFQKKLSRAKGKEKITIPQTPVDPDLEKEIKKFLAKKLKPALFQKDKQERQNSLGNLKEELLEKITADWGEDKAGAGKRIFEKEKEIILRETVLEKEERVDRRKLDEIREIKTEVGILPRTHGSGIFQRGETKALSILTLGAPGDQQLLEGMEISGKKRFLHHYNFPPYSVGEVKMLRGPGRREIGHGMLAEKALLPLIPKFEDFPYTIRIVSELLSSNGSTSMASISSSVLALMDGGVPIKSPAAGIAIGLISDKKGPYKILTDIQGPEDSLGDMDFKVAGTEKGITAIQMDVKIKGISQQILKEALERGKKARLEILKIQAKALSQPRNQLSKFAPRVYTIKINPEKIGAVIGPGGKVINEIIEDCGVSIDIEESGRIFVTAESEPAAEKAIDWIKNLTREVKVGEIFRGKVRRILDFGAIVELFPGQDGLVHISQLADFHVEKIQDLLRVGDIIPVKVVGIDDQGRINLSAKKAGFKAKARQ